MLPELGQIGSITTRTYTLLLDLAVLMGLGILTWQGWRIEQRPTAWLDAGLGAIVLGAIAARLGHVAIHWAYFSNHITEIAEVWRGGLDWHAAILGGLIGLALVCRWRQVSLPIVLDVLAVVLPLGAIFVSTGCLMESCGHGREVASLADYPPLVAAELPDLYGIRAPRLISQGYGIILALIVLVIALGTAQRIPHPGRFWLVLLLLGLGLFGIGFTRGDSVPMVGVLRLDQILDLLIVAMAIPGLIFSIRLRPIYIVSGPAGLTRK